MQPLSKSSLWTARILGAIGSIFILFDAITHILKLPQVVSASVQLGWSAEAIFWVGLVELLCLALYLFPKTAVLGAILLTGFLGGAIASNVRVGNPVFNIIFALIIAATLWLPLWIRLPQMRELTPYKK